MRKNQISRREQIIPLTGVRGVAAVWVLLYHANNVLGAHGLAARWPVLSRGYLGVDLFFALSGFVLAMTYMSSFQELHIRNVMHFFGSRAFRIMPLHWTVLFLFAIVAPIIHGSWIVALRMTVLIG